MLVQVYKLKCAFLCVILGYGGLSLAIEGPHRSNIECYQINDRVYTIHYSPHEPGIYILNIRFADEHVPGDFPVLMETWHFLDLKI